MAQPKKTDRTETRKTLWQPPEQRGAVSEEGKKWVDENAEAIRQWKDWADKTDLPLAKYRLF